jgi:hypothetical protein
VGQDAALAVAGAASVELAGALSVDSWPPARTTTAAIVTHARIRAATMRRMSRRFTAYLHELVTG